MPYSCHVSAGRIVVEPAEEQVFAIVGSRQQQPLTFCINDDPGRCRTWMAQRFQIQCGSRDVAWLDVVAAASSRIEGPRAGRMKVDGGRLTIDLSPPRTGPAAGTACARGARFYDFRGRDRRERARDFDCFAERRDRSAGVLAHFPPGYAPIGPLSARVIFSTDPVAASATIPTIATASHAAAPAATSSNPGAAPVLAPLLAGVKSKAPASDPTGVGAAAPARLQAWATEVIAGPETAPPSSVASDPTDRTPALLVGLVAMVILAVGTLIGRRGRRGAVEDVTADFAPRSSPSPQSASLSLSARLDEARLFEIVKSDAASHATALHAALSSLTGVPALRQSILDALAVLERRQTSILAQPATTDDARRQMRQRLERVLHDLRRLREIGDSAKVSLAAGGAPSRGLPRDRESAFYALGVHADVDTKILKKLVDALRQSWHPDQARDDADRQMREDRIKEINVAWELIVGKRAAG